MPFQVILFKKRKADILTRLNLYPLKITFITAKNNVRQKYFQRYIFMPNLLVTLTAHLCLILYLILSVFRMLLHWCCFRIFNSCRAKSNLQWKSIVFFLFYIYFSSLFDYLSFNQEIYIISMVGKIIYATFQHIFGTLQFESHSNISLPTFSYKL